jgi:hypothetical protein
MPAPLFGVGRSSKLIVIPAKDVHGIAITTTIALIVTKFFIFHTPFIQKGLH